MRKTWNKHEGDVSIGRFRQQASLWRSAADFNWFLLKMFQKQLWDLRYHCNYKSVLSYKKTPAIETSGTTCNYTSICWSNQAWLYLALPGRDFILHRCNWYWSCHCSKVNWYFSVRASWCQHSQNLGISRQLRIVEFQNIFPSFWKSVSISWFSDISRTQSECFLIGIQLPNEAASEALRPTIRGTILCATIIRVNTMTITQNDSSLRFPETHTRTELFCHKIYIQDVSLFLLDSPAAVFLWIPCSVNLLSIGEF